MASRKLSLQPTPVKRSRAVLLRRRAELLEDAARIDRELADLEAIAAPADTFTSLDLPPGTSRRAFREAAALIPGAFRCGHVWHVDRAAWFAARAKPAARTSIALVASSPAVDDADDIIRGAGLRVTRRSA